MARGEDIYGSMGSVPQMTSVDGSGLGPMEVHASPEAYGAGIGKAVEGAGQAGEQLVQKYQQTQAEINADKAYSDVYVPGVSQLRQKFEKDRMGGNPADAYNNYMSGLKDLGESVVNSQDSFYGQKLVESQTIRHRATEVDSISREVSAAQSQADVAAGFGSVKAEAALGANNYQNQNALNNTEQVIHAKTTLTAERGGMDLSDPKTHDWINESANRTVGEMYTSAAMKAASNNDLESGYKLIQHPSVPLDKKFQVVDTLDQQSFDNHKVNTLMALKAGNPIPEKIGYVQSQVQASALDACKKDGRISPSECLATIDIESTKGAKDRFNPWQEKNLPSNATPEEKQSAAINDFAKAKEVAKNVLGQDPEYWQTYLVYQQGPAGGPALLRAYKDSPNAVAINTLIPAYKGDLSQASKAILGNNPLNQQYGPRMSVGQFVDAWKDRATKFYDKNQVGFQSENQGDQAATQPKQDTDIAKAIVDQHEKTGAAVLPSNNPMQAFRNYQSMYSDIEQKIMSMPNIYARQKYLEYFKQDFARSKSEADNYRDQLSYSALEKSTNPNFDFNRDLTPTDKVALAEANPQVYSHLSEGSNKGDSGKGDRWLQVKDDIVAGKINTPKQLTDMLNSGINANGVLEGIKVMKETNEIKKSDPDYAEQLTIARQNVQESLKLQFSARGRLSPNNVDQYNKYVALAINYINKRGEDEPSIAEKMDPDNKAFWKKNIAGLNGTKEQSAAMSFKDGLPASDTAPDKGSITKLQQSWISEPDQKKRDGLVPILKSEIDSIPDQKTREYNLAVLSYHLYDVYNDPETTQDRKNAILRDMVTLGISKSERPASPLTPKAPISE